MMRKAPIAGLLLPVMLAGCSWLTGDDGMFRDKALDYQQAREVPPLVVDGPGGPVERRPLFPVPALPEQQASAQDSFQPTPDNEVPRAANPLTDPTYHGVYLIKEGEREWLSVARPAQQVWDTVQLFVRAAGLATERVDAQQGVIETAWLKPNLKGDKGFWRSLRESLFGNPLKGRLEKFLFQVTPGDQDGWSVLTISHALAAEQAVAAGPVQPEWNGPSSDQRFVSAVLSDVTDFLLDENAEAGNAFAQRLSQQPTHFLARDGNGFPVLVLRADFNRAWVALTDALTEAGLDIKDRNRSMGVFYLASATEPGDDEESDIDKTQYQLKLNRSEQGTQVSVQWNDESLVPADEAEGLLRVIRARLPQ